MTIEEAAIKYPDEIEYCHIIHELFQLEIVENNSFYIDRPKWCEIKNIINNYTLDVRGL